MASRLEKLREYLTTLKAIQKYDPKRFKSEIFVHAAAERYLQLAIECLLDIGNHIISDQGFRKPDTYAEVFEVLLQNRIIPAKLYKEIESMTAFRNVLVHDYLRLDLDRVYEVLQHKLQHIEKLGTIFGRLLD